MVCFNARKCGIVRSVYLTAAFCVVLGKHLTDLSVLCAIVFCEVYSLAYVAESMEVTTTTWAAKVEVETESELREILNE